MYAFSAFPHYTEITLLEMKIIVAIIQNSAVTCSIIQNWNMKMDKQCYILNNSPLVLSSEGELCLLWLVPDTVKETHITRPCMC